MSKKINKNKKMQVFDVCFEDNGDLSAFHWPDRYTHIKREPNSNFPDTLEYTGYFGSRGGNSHIQLKSVNTGRTYHMFMSDFDEVLREKKFVNNQLSGFFHFCKKGSSQGIRFIFENKP